MSSRQRCDCTCLKDRMTSVFTWYDIVISGSFSWLPSRPSHNKMFLPSCYLDYAANTVLICLCFLDSQYSKFQKLIVERLMWIEHWNRLYLTFLYQCQAWSEYESRKMEKNIKIKVDQPCPLNCECSFWPGACPLGIIPAVLSLRMPRRSDTLYTLYL